MGHSSHDRTPDLNARHSNDAEGYDRRRTTWLNERRTQYVMQVLAGVGAGGRVLEVGSGTGLLLRELGLRRPDLSFTGVEPLANYVELSREAAARAGVGNVTFVEGTGEDLAATGVDGGFDAVLSNDTLHHVADVPAVAARLGEVARPGATWLAIEPSSANPYVLVRHAIEPGERNFFPHRFAPQAESAGWRVVEKQHLFLIPPQIRRPPSWLKGVERRLEGVRGLAGGVALRMVRA